MFCMRGGVASAGFYAYYGMILTYTHTTPLFARVQGKPSTYFSNSNAQIGNLPLEDKGHNV